MGTFFYASLPGQRGRRKAQISKKKKKENAKREFFAKVSSFDLSIVS